MKACNMNVVLLHLAKYGPHLTIKYLCFDVLFCAKLYLMIEVDTYIYLEKGLFTIVACYMTYNHATWYIIMHKLMSLCE